jgi:hypothetical protein
MKQHGRKSGYTLLLNTSMRLTIPQDIALLVCCCLQLCISVYNANDMFSCLIMSVIFKSTNKKPRNLRRGFMYQ